MKTPCLNKRDIQTVDLSGHYMVEPGVYYLVYAPLAGMVFVADAETLSCLEEEAADSGSHPDLSELLEQLSCKDEDVEGRIVRDPSHYESMSILPNFICNLHCAYCYSAKGRSNVRIDPDVLRSALDFFIDSDRTGSRRLSLFISGGGEPLVSWDTVKFAIEYGRCRALEHGVELDIMLMTNATLVTHEIAQVLRENNVNVGVSFEILKDIQESQRGKFDVVAANIRTLSVNGVNPSLSSVITSRNVTRMDEMVEEVIREYPGVRHLNFDPAMSCDMFGSAEELDAFYDLFLVNFFHAKEKCGRHGITLDCNVVRKAEKIFPRYCQGKLALTPEGKISICHSVSSPLEAAYDAAIYGEVHPDGSVAFDKEKFSRLIDRNNFLLPRCEECVARWHCAGGCLMYRNNYDDSYFRSVCRFTAKAIAAILLMRLEMSYQKEEGTGLETILGAKRRI